MYPAKIFRQFSFYIHFKRSVLHKKPWWSIRSYSERYLSSIAFKESSEINDPAVLLFFMEFNVFGKKIWTKLKQMQKYFLLDALTKKDLKDL